MTVPIVDQPINCAACGAGIQGSDTDSVCPACGKPVEETLRQVGVDPTLMVVDADVICLHCGYNLRTIPIGAVCPECGNAVVTSLRVDDLRNADTGWLRRVRSGVTLILLAILGVVAMYALFIIIMLVAGFRSPLNDISSTAGTVIYIVLLIVSCVGLFKATASDPSPAAHGLSHSYRNIARTCAIIPIVMMPVVWYLTSRFNPSSGAPIGNASTMMLISMLSTAFLVLMLGTCAICLVVCLRRLFHRARRIGLRRLATVQIALVAFGILFAMTAFAFAAVVFPRFITPAVTATMTPTTLPVSTLPVANISNPVPGVTVEDYSAIDEEKTEVSTVSTTTTSPAGFTGGTGITTVTTTTVVASPFAGGFFFGMMVTYCGSGLFFVVCLILGVIVLVRSRRLLTEMLALKGS